MAKPAQCIPGKEQYGSNSIKNGAELSQHISNTVETGVSNSGGAFQAAQTVTEQASGDSVLRDGSAYIASGMSLRSDLRDHGFELNLLHSNAIPAASAIG